MNNEIKSTAPKPFIFVLMPFDKKFKDTYTFGIKGAADDAGAYAERVDEQIFTEGILERIFNQISKADVIVADMTGRNPNVFYEVGYAHALGKVVLLLTQNADDIPFDLKHRQHIVYGGEIETLRGELSQRLIWAIGESKRKQGQNISEQFFISLFGKEIPESRLSLEIPLFVIDRDEELPIFIRNNSPESSPPINHIYLITQYGSKLCPLRESINEIIKKEQYVGDNLCDFDPYKIQPAIFDSPNGKIMQYPLSVTIPSLPPEAIGNFSISLIGWSKEELLSIRIHTLSDYYNFPFRVTK